MENAGSGGRRGPANGLEIRAQRKNGCKAPEISNLAEALKFALAGRHVCDIFGCDAKRYIYIREHICSLASGLRRGHPSVTNDWPRRRARSLISEDEAPQPDSKRFRLPPGKRRPAGALAESSLWDDEGAFGLKSDI